LIPRSLQRDVQNRDVKSFPQSEMISLGVPCLANTYRKKSMGTSPESMSENVGMKSAIFVSQWTITRIMSWPSDRGNPSMKSIEIESHGYSPMGKNRRGPKGL
jgi:hypothetical protein